MPAPWKWATFLSLAVAAVLLAWFFFFRTTAGPPPSSTSQPLPRPALGKTIPYEQYTTSVDQALDDVRAAQSLSGSDRKRKLQDAASALGQLEGASVSA